MLEEALESVVDETTEIRLDTDSRPALDVNAPDGKFDDDGRSSFSRNAESTQ